MPSRCGQRPPPGDAWRAAGGASAHSQQRNDEEPRTDTGQNMRMAHTTAACLMGNQELQRACVPCKVLPPCPRTSAANCIASSSFLPAQALEPPPCRCRGHVTYTGAKCTAAAAAQVRHAAEQEVCWAQATCLGPPRCARASEKLRLTTEPGRGPEGTAAAAPLLLPRWRGRARRYHPRLTKLLSKAGGISRLLCTAAAVG
jgi:hypothetical protein